MQRAPTERGRKITFFEPEAYQRRQWKKPAPPNLTRAVSST
jgi:hypothetical protein